MNSNCNSINFPFDKENETDHPKSQLIKDGLLKFLLHKNLSQSSHACILAEMFITIIYNSSIIWSAMFYSCSM